MSALSGISIDPLALQKDLDRQKGQIGSAVICICQDMMNKVNLKSIQIQFNCPSHGVIILDSRPVAPVVTNHVQDSVKKFIAPSTLR